VLDRLLDGVLLLGVAGLSYCYRDIVDSMRSEARLYERSLSLHEARDGDAERVNAVYPFTLNILVSSRSGKWRKKYEVSCRTDMTAHDVPRNFVNAALETGMVIELWGERD
jgi:hypothetical protein